jgi:hypothetical protein
VFRQRLVLVETPERLRQELWEPQITFRMRGRAGPYQHLLSELPFVRTVACSDDTLLAALTTGAAKREAVAAMVRRLVEAGADLFDVGEEPYSQENAYQVLLEGEQAGNHSAPARPEMLIQPPTGGQMKRGSRDEG